MRALVLVLLTACGGDSDPPGKAEVTCGASWGTTIAGSCDEACVEMKTGTEPSCATDIAANGGEVVCPMTFDFEGERGCCFDLGLEGRVSGPNEPRRTRRVFFLSCRD
jgi:hypothetical protein